jgi:ABC-type transport system substrate-binding protein
MKLLVGWSRCPVLGILVMILGLTLTPTSSGYAQTPKVLRVGLAEDPDILDPTLARTFVGRIVFASLCDKLYDIDPNLNIVPQLATSLPQRAADGKTLTIPLRQGVKFHDGTEFNAEAAKFSLERHANLPGSQRKSDIASLDKVEIIDPFTIRLTLHNPFAPFLAQLTDRAGMMVSPQAVQALGEKFGTQPVCAGSFKLKERVAQDRIVLERLPSTGSETRFSLIRSSLRSSSIPVCGWGTYKPVNWTCSSACVPPTSLKSVRIEMWCSPQWSAWATRASPSTSLIATAIARPRGR